MKGSFISTLHVKKSVLPYADKVEEIIRASSTPQSATHLLNAWDLLLAQYKKWYKGPLI